MEELFAVEMEGASVAQVAKQEKIPFQIIRVISMRLMKTHLRTSQNSLLNTTTTRRS